MLTAKAPGKLILSGEHAVLHGKRALAMAVNRYVETNIYTEIQKNKVSQDKQLIIDILTLGYKKILNICDLPEIKQNLELRYKKFLANKCNIKEVLQMPGELLLYALSFFNLPNGLNFKLSSTVPLSSGMGSSAAAIISILYALINYLKLTYSAEKILALAQKIENLQHGISSGLDLSLSMHGGVLVFQRNNCGVKAKQSVLAQPVGPLYIINTGKSSTTTGECVVAANKVFGLKHDLLEQFDSVTKHAIAAWCDGNAEEFAIAIKENHQLLLQLKVVPTKIAQLIQVLENFGAAAKICGAGNIASTSVSAGIILVVTNKPIAAWAKLQQQYNFTLEPIEIAKNGVSIKNSG